MIKQIFALNTCRWTLLALAGLSFSPTAEVARVPVRPTVKLSSLAKVEVEAPRLSLYPAERGQYEIPIKVWQQNLPNAQPIDASFLVTDGLPLTLRDAFASDTPLVERRVQERIASAKLPSDPQNKALFRDVEGALSADCHYKVQPDVLLSMDVERKVAQLAETQFKQGADPLTITSGTRTPIAQAEAMLTKIRLGDPILRLYKDKKAAEAVLHSFRLARHSNASEEKIVNAMAYAIELQMEAGIYISNHLKSGAVDVRSRDMTAADKSDFLASVQETPGLKLGSEESKPPHFHVDVD